MPEETESTEQQQAEAGAEETVEETAPEGSGSTESTDDAQEAESEVEEKPFDRKQAEAKIRKANQEAKSLRQRLKELEPKAAELQRIKDAEKTESERLNDQLERANEQITKTRQRLVKARVQALAGAAAGERPAFADPADAFGELDLDSYLDGDGDINEEAIEADLQALLERKPHWAKPQPPEGPRRPAPDRTQASGANKTRTPNPRDEFAGWLSTRLP
jgi:DNA repair exonuclease SbcCD ATPase subunit